MRIEERLITCIRRPPFLLGKQGENRVTRFVIDFAPWLLEYPDGIITGRFMTPDRDIIPILLIRRGSLFNWTVTYKETAVHGDGRVEFVLTDSSGSVLKSAVGETFVAKSIIPIYDDLNPPPVVEVNFAETAGKLEEARAIVLSGDVNGQTSFDGSEDVELHTVIHAITVDDIRRIMQ